MQTLATAARLNPVSEEPYVQKTKGSEKVVDCETVTKGQKVFVSQGRSVKIRYSSDCDLKLKSGYVHTVSAGIPCEGKRMGLMKTPYRNYIPKNDKDNVSTALPFLIGGADVVGIITGAILGCSDENAKPARAA